MFHQNLSLCLSSARNGVGESYTALLVLGPIIVLSVAFSLYFILWRKKGRRELPDADLPLIPSLAMARESPHFKLVRGIEVTDLGGIHECYMAKLAEDGHSVITVNVSAERLPEVIPALMKEVGGLPEFVVQLPCTEEVERTLRHRPDDPWHSDIFRMENVAYEYLVGLLGRYGELLLHDGWATFHYGVLATPYDAVCVGYGKTIWIHTNEPEKYLRVLERLGYTEELELRTIHSNIKPGTPAVVKFIKVEGKGVYDMVEELKAEGLHMHERKED